MHDYKIRHVPGKTHIASNTVSKNPGVKDIGIKDSTVMLIAADKNDRYNNKSDNSNEQSLVLALTSSFGSVEKLCAITWDCIRESSSTTKNVSH